MVVTRAQDASISCPAGLPPPTRQQEANPPAADPPVACSPPDAAVQTAERLATLSQQVQNLTAMIHGLQQQQSMATQHQTAPLVSQQSARGGSPRWEACRRETGRRQASPRKPRREPSKRPRSSDRGPNKFPPKPPSRFDQRPQALVPKVRFTPLTAPISHILLEIEEEPYFQRPRPLKSINPHNKELYCRYHQDCGHDTEDCRQLKKAIEKFVQQGHLGKFVRGNLTAPGASAPPAPQICLNNAPTEGTIA